MASADSEGDYENYSSNDLSPLTGPRRAPASPIVVGCSSLTLPVGRPVGRQGMHHRQSIDRSR